MEQIFFGAFMSFCICFYAMPIIIIIANKKKLYDIPDARKLHTKPISSLGGIGIFAGFLFSILFCTKSLDIINGFQYFIAALMIIFFFGVKDDIMVLTPLKKLLGQIFTASILVFKVGFVITDLHGFVNIHLVNETVAWCFSIFTILVIMNAFNLIDGVDGLSGTIGLISSAVFGFLFIKNGDMFFALIAFSLTAALFAFLIFNYAPAKIFMGDTGAMLNGAINAILVIRLIQTAHTFTTFPINVSPALGFGILLIPLLDTLRVFSIRIIQGRSPFMPEKNHLHHLLLNLGMSHLKVTLSIASASIFFIILTFILLPLGTTLLIVTQMIVFYVGIFILYLKQPKTKQEQLIVKGNFTKLRNKVKQSKAVIHVVGNTLTKIDKQ